MVGKQAVPPASDKDVVTLGLKAVKATTVSELVVEFKRIFGIGSELALRLSKNADFVKAYQENARILQVIANALPEVEVTVKGKKFATYREALLTGCADDPKLFTVMNSAIEEAIEGVKNAEDVKPFVEYAATRRKMTEYMNKNGDFNKDYFANAVLNSAVFRYAALDAKGWGKIDEARKAFTIHPNSNVLVVERRMKNGKPIQEVSHSGGRTADRTSESIEGTIKKVNEDNKHFDQFTVGGPRIQDSESKYFEDLLEKLEKKELRAEDIEELILYTERPVCPSCLNVIRDFKKRFNIEITVYEGKYKR